MLQHETEEMGELDTAVQADAQSGEDASCLRRSRALAQQVIRRRRHPPPRCNAGLRKSNHVGEQI